VNAQLAPTQSLLLTESTYVSVQYALYCCLILTKIIGIHLQISVQHLNIPISYVMKIHLVVLNLLHVGMDRQTDFAKLIFTSLQILVANMPEKALSTYGQMICHCDHKSSSVLGVEYTVLI
jgi:hypothetical protein